MNKFKKCYKCRKENRVEWCDGEWWGRVGCFYIRRGVIFDLKFGEWEEVSYEDVGGKRVVDRSNS